jgi:hypothetical protein
VWKAQEREVKGVAKAHCLQFWKGRGRRKDKSDNDKPKVHLLCQKNHCANLIRKFVVGYLTATSYCGKPDFLTLES